MKKILLLTILAAISTASVAQNVGIGSTSFVPNSDAILELRSTTSGFLMPKMTFAQMSAIAGPTEGLLVYQSNLTPGFKYFDGSAWVPFGGSSGGADNFGSHVAEMNIALDDYCLGRLLVK
jgi:hypothetical protein